jgi:hypothetical protein
MAQRRQRGVRGDEAQGRQPATENEAEGDGTSRRGRRVHHPPVRYRGDQIEAGRACPLIRERREGVREPLRFRGEQLIDNVVTNSEAVQVRRMRRLSRVTIEEHQTWQSSSHGDGPDQQVCQMRTIIHTHTIRPLHIHRPHIHYRVWSVIEPRGRGRSNANQ